MVQSFAKKWSAAQIHDNWAQVRKLHIQIHNHKLTESATMAALFVQNHTANIRMDANNEQRNR